MKNKNSIAVRLVSGGAWALIGKILTVVLGLVVNALLARLLTPEDIGSYFLTLSLVGGASLVSQLGLNHAVVRLIAESISSNEFSRARMVVYKVLFLVAIGVIFVGSFLYFGFGDWLALEIFKSPLMAGIAGLTVVWIAVFSFQQIAAEIFRGFHDIRLASVFGGFVTNLLAAVSFAVLWLLQGHSNLQQVVILSVFAGGASALFGWVLIWGKARKLEGVGSLNAVDILAISWPLLFTNLTLFVLNHADIWILGALNDSQSVAIYGASSRLLLLITLPLVVINAVVMPMIAEMYSLRRMRELEHILRSVASISSFSAMLVFCGFIFIGKYLLGIIFGEFYQSGFQVLIFLSLGQLMNIVVGSCGYALMMTGYQTLMMWLSFASGLVTISLALLLVRPYGASGVAFSSAIGLGIQSIAMWISVKRALGIWTHANFRGVGNFKEIMKIV